MNDATVAKTILAQLGGQSRIAAMLGARDFAYSKDSLHFRIGSGAVNKANRLSITLDPSDTYTVKFIGGRGVNIREVGSVSDVYAGSLKATIEKNLGMYLSL
jgi:hypothetical protein